MKSGTIKTEEMEMRYCSFGEGERQLVILPGLDTKSVLLAAPVIENAYRCFSQDFTVTVFDRRTDMPDPYSIREMARDTALAMQKLDIKEANIFGASQGGMIAQYIAIDFPDLVASLILGSTICRENPMAREVIGRWITLAEQGDRRGLSKDFTETLYSKAFQEKYGDLLLKFNDHVSDEDLRRFVICAKAIEGFDTTDELDKISCPVFVIGSLGDLVVGKDSSRELAHYLHCECYLYDENTAHCVFDEAPDYKNRMLDFLAKIRE
ncbi:MAG: alpha/beta hydrolase [Ruminococcus sp.]|nr:alpha/beta hydrolase [Ruminococcus sp.]